MSRTMSRSSANTRINGAVRQLLRDVVTQHGQHSQIGQRAMAILTSGQNVMRTSELNRFGRMLGAW